LQSEHFSIEMGVCSSSAGLSPIEAQAVKQSKEIENKMVADHLVDVAVKKLLLLGAGGSGKSTLFKQMISIYGKGFSDQDRAGYAKIICENIITAMKTLCSQALSMGLKVAAEREAKEFMELEFKDRNSIKINKSHAALVKVLWRDPGIQSAFERQSGFQLVDSAQYFFDKVDEVAADGYTPIDQDVFRCRSATTGIVETNFTINGSEFSMFDVGGQRNERKKWIHCFENVTAVLFVAAISEYDQVLYEDNTKNRIEEALELFEEIANNKWFANTSVILFLNKRDIFKEKIHRVPLKNYFNEYEGGDNYDKAVEFITAKFRNLRQVQGKLYHHVTCATDSENVAFVFNAVQHIVVSGAMAQAGLV